MADEVDVTGQRYGMFGLTEAEVRAHGVTLLRAEAEAVLDALTPDQIRIVQKESWSGALTGVHILYQGVWRELQRSDLAQQVRSSIGASSEALFKTAPVQYYRDLIVYGAFVRDDAFVIIDALTDG